MMLPQLCFELDFCACKHIVNPLVGTGYIAYISFDRIRRYDVSGKNVGLDIDRLAPPPPPESDTSSPRIGGLNLFGQKKNHMYISEQPWPRSKPPVLVQW